MLVPIEWDSNMSLYCIASNYTSLSPVDQGLKELIKLGNHTKRTIAT